MYGIATASCGTLAGLGSGDHSRTFRRGTKANAVITATIATAPTTQAILVSITITGSPFGY